MLLVIEREIFSFSEIKRKKERKKETLFRPSIDEIPFIVYLFPLSALLDNQNNQLHYNKTLYYTMLASTSGGALFSRSTRSLSF